MNNREIQAAWKYHNGSKHSYWSIRKDPHFLDWANRPLPFKIYPGIETLPLPRDLPQTGVAALSAIADPLPSSPADLVPDLEDLTRILVNLVKNAVEAMPRGGRIRLTTSEAPAGPDQNACVLLNVEDNGPRIPLSSLERIFDTGYTTRSIETDGYGTWNPEHHGLGLSITRSLVERAGGRIHAANRDPLGTCFQIELPARAV